VSARRNYLLALLTVILAFNYVDRFALGVLLQDIKVDLALTDTQLGFLTGLAFAVFYAIMGIPIARWADRGNRVTIISVTVALWSVAVAACAVARSFPQLLLMRMGVAVGEAGCYPPALSLISDYFERAERPRAVARYMLGICLALGIGYFAAGWLDQYYGWRVTFLALGIPGVLLAILAGLTLYEPRRGKGVDIRSDPDAENEECASTPTPSLKEVLRTLWTNGTFRHIFLAFSVWGFFGYGIQQWLPAFFARSHGLSSGELGTWLALVNGVVGFFATLIGGELASRYAAHNERLQLQAISVVYCICALMLIGVYLAPSYRLAFALLAIYSAGGFGANGPLFAATQTIVPPRMRAMSISLMYFFCNLIGMGLGPLAVGALSDALRPWAGEESMRYALLAFCPGYFWCAWHFWRASRCVAGDIAAARVRESSTSDEVSESVGRTGSFTAVNL
jgi:predicted MFS family arabinose efflux permease